MIQPVQQAILQRLAAVCELSEEVRFGQLIAFLPLLAPGETTPRLADMEDDDLLRALEQHHCDLLARQQADVAAPS